MYGYRTWPIIGMSADKVGSCEMRMLRYCMGISLEEHRCNKEITKKSKSDTDQRCNAAEKQMKISEWQMR